MERMKKKDWKRRFHREGEKVQLMKEDTHLAESCLLPSAIPFPGHP